MEAPRIREYQYKYLTEIRLLEENKTAYCSNETCFDTHDVVKKGCTYQSSKCRLNVPSTQVKRIIILNAASANGCVAIVSIIGSK